MTYGSNGTSVTLTMDGEEARTFENNHPVIKRTSYRKGIVEIEVRKRVVCPTLTTRMFLKGAVSETASRGQLTVAQFLEKIDKVDRLGLTVPREVRADLERFANEIGGEVPINEVMDG